MFSDFVNGNSVNVSNYCVSPSKPSFKGSRFHTINPSFKVVDNVDTIEIGDVETNSKSNSFLKDFVELKAKKAGVSIPENFQITVTSPKSYNKDFKTLLSAVANGIYGARVLDMFNLLSQNKDKVNEKVSQMQITEEEKQEILKLKSLFDNYYKIELKNGDKSYNLLELTNDDKKAIQEISPEFKEFCENLQPELKKQSQHFTQAEISRLRLDEAGTNSKQLAKVLAPILIGCVAWGVFKSRSIAKSINSNLAAFLKEQAEVLNAGAPKFKNPLTEFTKAKGAALLGLIFTSLAGSWDDLAGCVKDFQQDKDNFGTKKALKIGIPAAMLGVGSSMAIAPMIEDQISYNTAVKYLTKYKDKLPELGIDIKKLPATGLKNVFKTGGKVAIIGLLIAGVTNAIKGMITASSSSGSSWGSMAGTKWLIGNLGDKLAKHKIISEQDNTSSNTNKNMMAYEAYKGKWTGIAQQDPLIGGVGGALGLFTHSNPYIQSLSFGLQGCSETLTACYYQLTGAKDRNSKLDKEKAALIANLK